MQIIRYQDPTEFLATIEPTLLAEEARHGLVLGVVNRLVTNPDFTRDPYLALVREGDQIVLVAMHTPPFGIVLSECAPVTEKAVDLLLDDVLHLNPQPVDVNASKALSLRFAQGWAAKTGGSTRLEMAQRIYELKSVAPEMRTAAPGAMRPAIRQDAERFHQWVVAFEIDAFGEQHSEQERIHKMFSDRWRDVFFWDHAGQTVSMCIRSRPTAHGITVGLVYTPPELRKRGYATALVANLSQHLLESGYQFCTLYTDLANPTSNAIYQHIGYRPVADVDKYTLTPA